MRLPRQFFIVAGSAAIIASIAVGGLSFGSVLDSVEAVGDATPDPTAAASETQGPPKTHTPTPQSTSAPTEEPEATNTAPAAPTTAPATNTPTGGSGAGGVAPPNTGTGGDASSQNQWLIAAGSVMLLAGGAGSIGFGLRRR